MAHALVPMGLAWYAPEIGVLMLMVLFITFGFGALRVNPNRLQSGAIFGTTGGGGRRVRHRRAGR